jgi:drug/metabolite transporter (DMT)-like permease
LADISLAQGLERVSASRPLRAYLALAFGVLCISFTAIFTKWAGMPGPVAASWRMIFAAAILAIPFFRQARSWTPAHRRSVPWGVVGGLWFAINLGMLNSALMLTSAANATLLDNTAPIWVGLGALIIFKERLTARYWLGLVLALAGAAVVSGLSAGGATSGGGFKLGLGDVLAFVGALFYAGYLLNTQRGRRDLDSLSYLWIVSITAAVALMLFSLAMRLPLTGHPVHAYGAIVGVAIVSQVGGWLLINYALGHLPASSAVVVLLAQPVITGLLSIPLLGEMITVPQLVGGALALTGIYLCLRRQV